MKFSKKLLFVILIFLLSNLVCFALPEKPLALSVSLGTSAVAYGDEQIKEYKSVLFEQDSTRFVLNSEVSGMLFLDDYVAINLGGIAGFDWMKNTQADMFLVKYDIFAGLRIFPFLHGLNFGIDYICGSYTNFLKVNSAEKLEENSDLTSQTINSEWSNGFRLIVEYNFLQEDWKYTPAIGCYWQNMPRNNGYDNSFSVYIKFVAR